MTTTTDYQIHIDIPAGDILVDPVGRVRLWEEIPRLLRNVTFESDDGPIQIEIDWADTTAFVRRDTEESEKFYQNIEELRAIPDIAVGRDREPLVIKCSVSFPDDILKDDHYVHYLLYSIFLAGNLASPGGCNFFSAKIYQDNRVVEEQLRLSSYYAGAAYELSRKQGWPLITSLSFADAWKWVYTLSPKVSYIASSKVERAIFALLNVCSDDRMDPNILIWLAHALESLFDTPELGISKALRDRIFLLLGIPKTNWKSIRRSISNFYDLRSEFVHGKSAIAHPVGYKSGIESVVQMENKVLDESTFAVAIILASLQLMVRNAWHEIEFTEIFMGR